MNVEIMWKEVHKYDNGLPCIGAQMIKLWEHDNEPVKLWRVSANFIYTFKQNGKEMILRIVPNSERSIKLVQAELDFMAYLREQGLPILEPHLSINSNNIETTENENGIFHAVVYNKAPGKWIEFEELNENQWLEIGRMMARVHTASLKFQPHPKRKRRTWKEDIQITIDKMPENDSELVTIIRHLESIIENYPKGEYYGLIHYDFCYDNILWDNGSYIIIDFDDAAYYPFVADIAFGIDDIRDLEEQKRNNILNWFSKGYTEVKKLPENWQEQMELFFDLEDILKYSRTRYAYKGTNPDQYPEWLTKLKARHFKSMDNDKIRLVEKWKQIL